MLNALDEVVLQEVHVTEVLMRVFNQVNILFCDVGSCFVTEFLVVLLSLN